MKNKLRLILLFTFVAGGFGIANAQIELEGTLRAGPEDAQKYLQNYMEPAILSFANGLANGWVNTAKTHKILGVDLTFSINLATIPEEVYDFSYSKNTWSNLEFVSGEDQIPTLAGGTTNTMLRLRAGAVIRDPRTGQQIDYTASSEPFSAAPGLDASQIPFAGIPTPTFHVGIGLMKNTDLKIRFVPAVVTDDFEFRMFGVGVMHDIKQWIPGLKLVPIDIAGFFGTTTMSTKIAYEIDGDGSGDDFSTVGPASTEFKVSSTTIQVLASKKLAIFTPYVAIGYNIVSSNLDVKGTYRYTNDTGATLDLTDPVALEFGGGSSPRATIGAQLKLLILTIHADYTLQKYNTFSVGLGISVR